MKKHEIRNLLLLIGIVLVISIIIYMPFVINKVPFELVTIDTREQLYPFYTEFTRILDNFMKTGDFSFYSWANFLGNSFFVTKSFYLTTDITMYLAYFFKWFFWDAMMYTTIIKLVVCSVSMYLLLQSFNYKPTTRIVGALCYTFCSQVGYYTIYPMYLNVYCLLPLYFLGVEMNIRYNKKVVFILMTAILAISHVYYFYIISFFTIFYYLYRYYMIKSNLKYVIKDTVKIIGCYLVGILMSGFILIPFAIYLAENDRVGLMNISLLYDSTYPYVNIVSSLFSPYHVFQAINHPLKTSSYVINEVFLWAGTIITILLPQVFFDKEKKFKKATSILLISFGLFLFVPILNSIMHGFSETSFRASILLCIMNIIIACGYLDNLKRINMKVLKRTVISIIGFLLIVFPIASALNGNLTHFCSEYKELILIVLFQITMISVFYFILKFRGKWFHSIIFVAVLVDLFIPLYFETSLVPHDPERNSYQFMERASHVLQNQENGVNNYLNSLNIQNTSQYYRVYVDRSSLYWDVSMNAPLFYNVNGLSTYDTTHATSLNRLKDIAPEIILADSKDFDRFLNIDNYDLMTFLNTKYALVTDEMQLPEGKWTLVTESYLDFIRIYENDNYRSLGTTYDSVITYDDFNGDLNKLHESVICNGKDLPLISNYLGNSDTKLIDISYGNDFLVGNYSSDDDTFMVITIPYDSGWNIYIDGEKVDKYAVNGGFIGIPIIKGDHYIEMHFMPSGLKTGLICSSIGVIIFFGIISVEIIKKRTAKK